MLQATWTPSRAHQRDEASRRVLTSVLCEGGPVDTSCFFHLTPKRPLQDRVDSLPGASGSS